MTKKQCCERTSVLTAAEQGFHSITLPLFLIMPPHSCRFRVDKKLEGETARKADPIWPKGYSMLYSLTLSNKNGRGGEETFSKLVPAWKLSGHLSALGRGQWLSLHHCFPILLFFLPFFHLLNHLYLNPWTFPCFCPFYSCSHPTDVEWESDRVGAQLLTGIWNFTSLLQTQAQPEGKFLSH